MRRAWSAALLLAGVLWAGVGAAQENGQFRPPILTLDQERLFAQSRAAAQVSAEIEARAEALAAENRVIETELVAEELALTEQRPGMDPDEFRALADAFDEKVQAIRDEQDAKARELQRLRDEERQAFLQRITPVLAMIARERGAFVVLDRRSVFLSAEQIDITAEAVRRIDASLDSEPNRVPAPEQESEPDPAPQAEPEAPPQDPDD